VKNGVKNMQIAVDNGARTVYIYFSVREIVIIRKIDIP
jgi:hypothetical protein